MKRSRYVMALDTYLLYHLLVEVVEKLLTGIALVLRRSRLSKSPLELVELELNLLWCAALLVNRGDAFFRSRLPTLTAPSTSSLAPNTPLKSRNFSASSS